MLSGIQLAQGWARAPGVPPASAWAPPLGDTLYLLLNKLSPVLFL